MSTQTTCSRDMRELSEDARILLDATVNVAGDKVAKARKRLAAALERGTPGEETAAESAADRFQEIVGNLHTLLSTAREHGIELYGDVRDKTIAKVKSADEIVRGHPYRSIGIALAVGTLVGCLTASRHCRKGT